jgi:hypothetical protein
VTMKLPLPLTSILFCASLCAAVPLAAGAESSQQAGTATSAVAAAGTRASAGAGAGAAGAGISGASANAARAQAAQANLRLRARANEAKIAANAPSAIIARQQRAAVLQGQRKAQYAAQTLSRAHSRQRLSPALTADVPTGRFTTAGTLRATAAGEGLPLGSARGVTATPHPSLRATQTGAAPPIAPRSRVSAASGTIGGPQRQLSGRLGGAAMGPTGGNTAIDGSHMRRRF